MGRLGEIIDRRVGEAHVKHLENKEIRRIFAEIIIRRTKERRSYQLFKKGAALAGKVVDVPVSVVTGKLVDVGEWTIGKVEAHARSRASRRTR